MPHLPSPSASVDTVKTLMGVAFIVGSMILREFERKDDGADKPLEYEDESEDEKMMETSWGMA